MAPKTTTKPARTTPKRTTGTNAPGGEWYATPAAKRHRPARAVTAARSTWDALDAHVPDGTTRSEWIEETILERLRREGVKV